MIARKAISPFIATVVLVAITLTLGGVLYNQFSQVISAEVRNPSMALADFNIGGDRQTVVVNLKNDGNVQYTVSKVLFDFQSTEQRFVVGSANMSVISGFATLAPGGLLAIKFTITGVTLPNFSPFTLIVVSDQVARAFTVQG